MFEDVCMAWRKAKDGLKELLPSDVYSLWIKPLEFVRQEGQSVVLSAPDRYFIAFVKKNYTKDILKVYALVDPSIDEVRFIEAREAQQKTRRSPKKTAPASGARQLRLPSVPENNSSIRSLHPRYTFDEFMVGQSNILAESACRAISADADTVGPCVYINSGTGLGKSHLTHAVAHHVLSTAPMTRMHYVTAQQFSAEMVQGIKNNSMDIFKKKYQEHCDILLVEDIHALKGKKKTQEELNEIFDTLVKSGKRVILTANAAPRELSGIDGEFKSRMGAGLLTTIQAPDIKTRTRIVERKAFGQKIAIDPDMAGFLAQNIRGDIRQIESTVTAIAARARLMGGNVSMDLVREVVGTLVGCHQHLSSQIIRDLISVQFHVSVEELESRSRKKAITLPRQIAMYLSRKFTEESLSCIGRTYKRDHSTVLHSVKAITEKSRRDSSLGAQVNLLSDKVKQI